ncbi:ADP-ribosylglycohydrolase family protein [Gordonia rhizosphera]|uniref:Putative hydrolase n=1 Tax=Gordonia rhizosphera NBRC 16068 TaxID=1108045 RepID=K6WLK3_9ACTN|nr:ADP-ribosylglycohydrolase family protein [Gordonia rhizosphera]GAB93037.1 putative hydrolase [Gordonia rhizosphera NBRC 16068]
MHLTTAQTDRAAGVLLATAAGDALGVPYEFACLPLPADGERPEMLGGGLGPFAPGEWSDDTSMAIAIAEVTATGADLTTEESLDDIAQNFLRWFDGGPPDVGIQTRAVLGATRRRLDRGETGAGRIMRAEAEQYARTHPRSAGNGALMRTAPVTLAHLDDRDRLAEAARSVASLTHADPLAGDSCVLWCEAIRVAVLDGRIDIRAGLDLIPAERAGRWSTWLEQAGSDDPKSFTRNGFTVTALQAATAAVLQTPEPTGMSCRHLQDALYTAVGIGHDTDTVAAIAGGLLGARWGASAVPWFWRRAVHGWPRRDERPSDAHDLVALATLAVRGGKPDDKGWPTTDDVRYTEAASAIVVPHPFDDGVLLGTHATVDHHADAVVSMCRVGRGQTCFAGAAEVVASRLMDSDDPAANPNLEFVLADTADAVRGLRAEGKTVLLHCVAGQQRTPSVAVAYGVMLGHPEEQVRTAIRESMPDARGHGLVWEAASQVADRIETCGRT